MESNKLKLNSRKQAVWLLITTIVVAPFSFVLATAYGFSGASTNPITIAAGTAVGYFLVFNMAFFVIALATTIKPIYKNFFNFLVYIYGIFLVVTVILAIAGDL